MPAQPQSGAGVLGVAVAYSPVIHVTRHKHSFTQVWRTEILQKEAFLLFPAISEACAAKGSSECQETFARSRVLACTACSYLQKGRVRRDGVKQAKWVKWLQWLQDA